MANNTISVCINERHKTYMQACCADGICFGKFKDIETGILEVDPQPLFSNIHINENGVCVPSVPLTKKWSEFLFDLWNWRTHELFEENYVTQINVNHCGRGKLCCLAYYGQIQGKIPKTKPDTQCSGCANNHSGL